MKTLKFLVKHIITVIVITIIVFCCTYGFWWVGKTGVITIGGTATNHPTIMLWLLGMLFSILGVLIFILFLMIFYGVLLFYKSIFNKIKIKVEENERGSKMNIQDKIETMIVDAGYNNVTRYEFRVVVDVTKGESEIKLVESIEKEVLYKGE